MQIDWYRKSSYVVAEVVMVMKCGCERVERRRRKRTEGCEEVSEVHGWVHRREVHGSDYSEASRGVGE